MRFMKKDIIFISYIIPCYNVQKYLPRCLESLTKQTIANNIGIEYILINDGSTDSTLAILKEFVVADDRAILVDQKNQGVSAARNAGIRSAHGEYVYFLDGDDWLTDDASQIIFNACKEQADIIVTDACAVRETDLKKSLWNTCPGLKCGIYSCLQFVDSVKVLPISFKTYRRELLIQHNIFYDEDLKVGEVLCFFIHCLAYARKIAYSDGRIMNYLLRGGSVMREYKVDRDINIIDTMYRIDEYANLFSFNIRLKSSYLFSLYKLVNFFSIVKYLSAPLNDKKVKDFLVRVSQDTIYRNTLKGIISQSSFFDRRSVNPAILYYLSINWSFRFLRLKINASSCLKRILKH